MALPMTSFHGFLVDADGATITNALITITLDDEPAAFFADSAGEMPLPNPITIQAGSRLSFYIDVGVYTIDVMDLVDDSHQIYELTVEEESASTDLYLYENVIRDSNGNPVSNGYVTVKRSDGSLPNLYANIDGTIAAQNPFSANDLGEVSFYIEQGVYDFSVSSMLSGARFKDVMVPVMGFASAQLFQFIAAPLTYDEFLSDDVTALTVGGSGPHITNLGFKGNGIDSLYYYDAMPSWADGDNLYLQASITPLLPTRETTYLRDVIVSVGNTTPKLQFSVLQDPVNTAWLNVGFRGRNETANESHPYVRRDWKYHGRYPVLSAGGYDARPQSICFNVSDDGYTCVAHYEDQDSIFHVVDENGGLVDSYSFGSASHFSSLARDQSGRLWALDYTTGYLYRINEAVSMSTGTFTADITYNASAITGAGAIEFITYSGTDYLLIAQYLTIGTPYLYAVVATEFTNGGTLTLAERFKRFVIQFRCQGLAVSSFTGSTLYISSNRINAESAFGRIYTVNISSAMAGSDGATLSIVNLYQAPSQYPEDIDFDSAGRLWTLTEGQSSVGDKDGFLSIWSTNFTPQENHYSAYYNGSSVTVKVNNFVFETFDFVSGAVSASRLEIGGPIASIAGPGWENGYFAGYLRNVFVSNADASSETYNNVISGEYEPNTLTVVNLTLTNPGAKSGTTGWTNETGSIATRSTNPTPYEGSAYFSGGSNAQTISRQSVDLLSATGLLQSELNAKTAWVNLQWYQASFGGTDTDLCGMGLSFTNGGVETDRDYSSLINIPEDQVWCIRSFAKQVAADDDAVRIIYRSDRSSGTNNDGYVDSISAVLYYK